MAAYPVLAQRGLAIFVGDGKCTTCHSGPRLSSGEFHDVGISNFAEPGRVDPGRFGGIKKLQGSPYTLLGKYNDDAKRRTAISTRHVVLDHRNYGEFKVPSLRGVSETAPYMHNGSLATLREVVRHYSNFDVSGSTRTASASSYRSDSTSTTWMRWLRSWRRSNATTWFARAAQPGASPGL